MSIFQRRESTRRTTQHKRTAGWKMVQLQDPLCFPGKAKNFKSLQLPSSASTPLPHQTTRDKPTEPVIFNTPFGDMKIPEPTIYKLKMKSKLQIIDILLINNYHTVLKSTVWCFNKVMRLKWCRWNYKQCTAWSDSPDQGWAVCLELLSQHSKLL